MNIEFTPKAWEQYIFWLENNPEMAKKVNQLLGSIVRTPFSGIGNPEPLKDNFRGYWSRRIDTKHRLVYLISGKKGIDQKCSIVQCRYHYDDN